MRKLFVVHACYIEKFMCFTIKVLPFSLLYEKIYSGSIFLSVAMSPSDGVKKL